MADVRKLKDKAAEHLSKGRFAKAAERLFRAALESASEGKSARDKLLETMTFKGAENEDDAAHRADMIASLFPAELEAYASRSGLHGQAIQDLSFKLPVGAPELRLHGDEVCAIIQALLGL